MKQTLINHREKSLGVQLFRLTLAMILLCGFALASLASTPDDLYKYAANEYKKGHYRSAYNITVEILRTNPGHMASAVLAGKILYRMEKYKEAASYFELAEPKLLDPETTFEYGVAMYGAQRCTEALRAFHAVPQDYKYKNYAHFYGGACYMQRGDYARALIKLRKAVGLPPSFNAARRDMMTAARAQLGLVSRGGPVPPYAYPGIRAEAPGQGQTQKQAPQKGQKQAEKKQPSPFTLEITPSVEAKYGQKHQNYHNYKIEDDDQSESTTNLALNAKYERKDQKTKPSMALGLNVKRWDKIDSGGSANTLKLADSGVYSYESSSWRDSVDANHEYTVSPSVTVPITEKTSVITKAEYWQKDGKDGFSPVMESSRMANSTLHGTIAPIELDADATYEYKEHYNGDSDPSSYDSTYTLSLSKKILKSDLNLTGSYMTRHAPAGVAYTQAAAETYGGVKLTIPIFKFSLFGSAEYKMLTAPPDATAHLVDSDKMEKTDFNVSLERTFDFGLDAKIGGGYEMYGNLAYKDLPVGNINVDGDKAEKRWGNANGHQIFGYATATQNLFNCLYMGAWIKYQQDEYYIGDAQIAPAFYLKAPDDYLEWNFWIGIKKTF